MAWLLGRKRKESFTQPQTYQTSQLLSNLHPAWLLSQGLAIPSALTEHKDCTKEAKVQPNMLKTLKTLELQVFFHTFYFFLPTYRYGFKALHLDWVTGKILQTLASSSFYHVRVICSITLSAIWSFFYSVLWESISSSWIWLAELSTSYCYLKGTMLKVENKKSMQVCPGLCSY